MKRLSLISTTLLGVFIMFAYTMTGFGQTTESTVDVPGTISYQGLLTSPDGGAIEDGTYSITVTIYADEKGEQAVWQHTYPTSVAGGLFNIYLGTPDHPLPGSDVMNRPLWIGTKVGGSAELHPLTPLTSSPYALNVSDNAITAQKIAEGAVTADKVDMNYVSEVRVDGKRVTGKGSVLNLESGKDISLNYDAVTGSVKIESANAATGNKGDNDLTTQTVDHAWFSAGDLIAVPAGSPLAAAAATDWIGTGTPTTFNIKVNNVWAMRYQPSGAATPNVVGGNIANVVVAASVGSVIDGGGSGGFVLNFINGDYDAMGGGDNNVIGTAANAYDYSTLGGGQGNRIQNNWATLGGGAINTVNGQYGTVSGGQSNSVANTHGTVGGGLINVVNADYGTISGGDHNLVTALAGTIGGGEDHEVNDIYGTVGGGLSNIVAAGAPYGTIAGGTANNVNNQNGTVGGGNTNNVSGDFGTISGGTMSNITGQSGTVGGGATNNVDGDYGTVAGGQNNNVNVGAVHGTISGGQGNNIAGGAFEGTISGGQGNNVNAPQGTVGGGLSNHVNAPLGTVGGGMNNHINQQVGTVAGGQDNHINAMFGAVLGGRNNHINADYGTIGAGQDNIIHPMGVNGTIGGGQINMVDGDHATIGGGMGNNIMPMGLFATIGGGSNNHSDANRGTIGGGEGNNMLPPAAFATIGGGEVNHIDVPYGTIAGGQTNNVIAGGAHGSIGGGRSNFIDIHDATIGGGEANNIVAGGRWGTIGGGQTNLVDAERGTVGGGESNIVAAAPYGTIPGGDNLNVANSYAQTAVGFFNAPRGAVGIRPAPIALTDDPLFMVGNGDWAGGIPVRSNAFEVSYNGHSVVYDVNGSGGATVFPGRPAIRGANYVDNAIYAWADVPPSGGVAVGGLVVPNSDFGVASIVKVAVGVYDVTINVTDPVTGAVVVLTNASITATIVDDLIGTNGCGIITTTQIGAPGLNMFRIRTYMAGGCVPDDLPYMFKLTGRP